MDVVSLGECMVEMFCDGRIKDASLFTKAYGGDTLTHALLDGSQAIDGGACVVGVDTDQRGVSRPYGDDCDIGAFEWARKKIYLPLVLR